MPLPVCSLSTVSLFLLSSRLSTIDEVVDEIYTEVKNVEPMVAGRDRLPSTAFFLLYKLFTMKLNKPEMNGKGPTCLLTRARAHTQHPTRDIRCGSHFQEEPFRCAPVPLAPRSMH